MAKRILRVDLSSPDNNITPDELARITLVLNEMEDWQLTGERDEDVQDFAISASYNCEM